MRFCVVVDYTDTRFLNFAIFAKMEKFAKPFFSCSYGAQVESVKQKKVDSPTAYCIHSVMA